MEKNSISLYFQENNSDSAIEQKVNSTGGLADVT